MSNREAHEFFDNCAFEQERIEALNKDKAVLSFKIVEIEQKIAQVKQQAYKRPRKIQLSCFELHPYSLDGGQTYEWGYIYKTDERNPEPGAADQLKIVVRAYQGGRAFCEVRAQVSESPGYNPIYTHQFNTSGDSFAELETRAHKHLTALLAHDWFACMLARIPDGVAFGGTGRKLQ